MRAMGIQYAGDTARAEQVTGYKDIRMWNGSGAAIAAGDAVAIDETVTTHGRGSAIKTSATADPGMIIGGALVSIPNLSWGLVRVYGLQENVNVVTGAAAKALLIGSGAAAGRLIVHTGAAGEMIVARNLIVSAANVSPLVFWCNPLGA